MTQFNAVEWMANNGHPSYAREINDLKCVIDEIKGDAGRNWQFCEFTLASIAKVKAQITEVEEAALDRYQDWATD